MLIFIFVVVCNDKPVIEFLNEHIHYKIVDFPVPPVLDEYLKAFSNSDQDISCYPKKYFSIEVTRYRNVFGSFICQII
mgnify:CR=1 FL=1